MPPRFTLPIALTAFASLYMLSMSPVRSRAGRGSMSYLACSRIAVPTSAKRTSISGGTAIRYSSFSQSLDATRSSTSTSSWMFSGCPQPPTTCPWIRRSSETKPPANSPWPTTIARGFPGPPPESSLMIFLQVFTDVIRRCRFHSAHKAVVEGFGGIDAGVAQQMVHGNHLGDHGDVLARIQEDGDLRQLDVEYGRGLHVETRALDNRVLIPLFQLNDDFDAFLLAYRADAENCRDVDETNAANLHVMALDFVTSSNQDVVAALAGDD